MAQQKCLPRLLIHVKTVLLIDLDLILAPFLTVGDQITDRVVESVFLEFQFLSDPLPLTRGQVVLELTDGVMTVKQTLPEQTLGLILDRLDGVVGGLVKNGGRHLSLQS